MENYYENDKKRICIILLKFIFEISTFSFDKTQFCNFWGHYNRILINNSRFCKLKNE